MRKLLTVAAIWRRSNPCTYAQSDRPSNNRKHNLISFNQQVLARLNAWVATLAVQGAVPTLPIVSEVWGGNRKGAGCGGEGKRGEGYTCVRLVQRRGCNRLSCQRGLKHGGSGCHSHSAISWVFIRPLPSGARFVHSHAPQLCLTRDG